jgi:hypothetical protein
MVRSASGAAEACWIFLERLAPIVFEPHVSIEA